MAKAKASVGERKVSTSKMVRDWLKTHRNATVPEIIEAFKAQGITVSKPLASKIKYTSPTSGKSAGAGAKKKRGKPARGEKAAAIREAWTKMGRKARPRDVMASLSSTGLKISSSEVIGIRNRLFKRGGKKAAAATAEVAAAPSAGGLTLERLLAAKAVANKLGGVEAAYQAFLALSKLEG